MHLDILDIHVFRQLDIHTAIWIYIFNLDIDNTTLYTNITFQNFERQA